MPPEHQDALISPCGQYRYQLLRLWNPNKPLLLFLMKNPSRADALKDDHTIRKCRGFAQRLGYGGFYVGNLYAWRATSPQIPNGNTGIGNPENDHAIQEMRQQTNLIIAAWGNLTPLQTPRARSVIRQCHPQPLYALSLTQNGHPCHPARLPYTNTLIKLPTHYPQNP